MAFRDYLAGEIAEDFADGLLTRREALRRLGLMGVTVTAATTILAACGGDDDNKSSATTAPATTSTTANPTSAPKAEAIRFQGPAGELQAAWAAPSAPTARRGAVLVIHENRGLTPHFFDVVGRLAGAGYGALCVDLLSAQGGTASLKDPAGAPAALASAPTEQLVAQLRAGIDELQRRVPDKKVGAVGFCFGGGMTWNLLNAHETRLAAAVPFYGPAPDNLDFTGDKAAVLAIYGELDARVNATRDRAEAALKAAGLTYEIRTFPGADHAFFNDTGPRYNPTAAAEAYRALLDWFDEHLS